MTYFFTFIRYQRKTLSRAYPLCYSMQDHQTWCSSTSWHDEVSCTITRSQWHTFWEIKGKLCPRHIIYAISCRFTKLGVVEHHGMVQCRAPLLCHS